MRNVSKQFAVYITGLKADANKEGGIDVKITLLWRPSEDDDEHLLTGGRDGNQG